MRRFLRHFWAKATAWVMLPVTFLYFDSFQHWVLAQPAAREIHPAPAWPKPFVPPVTASSSLATLTVSIRDTLGQIQAKLSAGGDATALLASLAADKSSLETLKPGVDSELASAKATIVSESLGSAALAQWDALNSGFQSRYTTLDNDLATVLASPTLANVTAAYTYAKTLVAEKDQTLNTSQLPHRATSMIQWPWTPPKKGGAPPKDLLAYFAPTDTLRDITAGGSFPAASGAPTAADLAATPETASSPALVALASSLGNDPVRIFEYVKNNIRFEPYYGSVKGAAQTLREGAGNDFDQASLLIALFRASGIPARWVYGTIQVSMSDLTSWLSVDASAKALQVLSKNDFPYAVVSNTQVKLDHAWVQAFVDYVPHRGNSTAPGDRFVDLDPSFKRTISTPYESVTAQAGLDADGFLALIRARPGTVIDTVGSSVKGVDEPFILSTLSGFGAKIENLLAASGRTPASAFRLNSIESEAFGVLPASRRYSVTAIGAAYATLPSPIRFGVKFELLNADGSIASTFSDTTLSLAGKRITLSYKAATSADAAAIAANSSASDFPAYLVQLLPSLKVEGSEVATGPAIGMGLPQTLRVTLSTPLGGTVSKTDQPVLAGEVVGLAIDLSKVSAAHLAERRAKLEAAQAALGSATPPALDDVEGEILFDVALNLFFQADTLNAISANALDVVVQRQASLAFAIHQETVTPLFDLPFTVKADSVALNVARDVLFPVARSGSSTLEKQFLVTSGFATSALEKTSLVSFFVADATSTVGALEAADVAGQKIFTVTSANAASIVPLLTHPASVKDQVSSIAAAGLIITIPQSPVLLGGTRPVSAYIVLDPFLSSSAFVIKASPSLYGGLVLTEAVKAGDLLVLGPVADYAPILATGDAWMKSVAAATDSVGLEYIPAVASIADWFGTASVFDQLTTVAAAIAISGPLSFVASQPGIFNVQSSPAYLSSIAAPGSETVKATVTRGAPWTVKFFQITSTGPVLVGSASGTTPDVLATLPATGLADGDYTFRIEATGASPMGGAFKVDSTAPTAAITFPSTGASLTNPGLNLAIQGTANDANFKSYTLKAYPPGSPGSATTLITRTTPVVTGFLGPLNTTSMTSGTLTVELDVTDLAGNTSVATSTFSFTNPAINTTPPTVAITAPASGSSASGTITVSVNATSPVGVKQVTLFADGAVVGAQFTPASGSTYNFSLDTHYLSNATHTLIARAEDTGGTGGNPGYVTDSAPVTITTGNTISAFTVAPNPFNPITGPQFSTNVTATLPAFQSYTVTITTIDGGIKIVSGGGATVTYEPLPPGSPIRTITGSAQFVTQPWDGRDDSGNKVLEAGTAGLTVAGTYLLKLSSGGDSTQTVVFASSVHPPPVAQIFSPTDLQDVKAPTPIRGSAFSLAGDSITWKLELFRLGSGTPTLLASGTGSIQNSVLATLDPTLLDNDFYRLVLTATDSVTSVAAEANLQLVGQLKIGIFTLTFTDMAVPLKGIPITIQRTYDTRLTGAGDWGTGWRLNVVSGNLRVRDKDKSVMVTLADNRRTRFLFKPIDATAALNNFTQTQLGGAVPEVFTPYRTANYEPETTQTKWTLQSKGPQDILALPTQFRTINTQFGPVPQVTAVKFVYYDFTDYNPPGYVVSDQLGTRYTYASTGKLQSVVDTNGNTLTITDTAITHSSGVSITISRDASGQITAITDPSGKSVTYAYPFLGGQLASSTDREGHLTQYVYLAGKIDHIVDPRGVTAIKNVYDSNGRLVSHTDANGNTINYNHNLSANQEIVTDRRGNIQILTYDNDGNVASETDSLGHTRFHEYDAAGNEIVSTNELGQMTRSTFDARGNLLTRADPLGAVMTFNRNDRGQIIQMIDPLGRINSKFYDTSGNLIGTADALGNNTVNHYDDSGLLIASVDTLGTRTEFDHDPVGNVSEQRVIDATGTLLRKVTFTYDAMNRPITQTVWQFSAATGIFSPYATISSAYNSNGQVVKVTDPLGFFTQTFYDDIGQQAKVIDKNGNVTTFAYNNIGLLQQTTYPVIGGASPTEVIGYDENGNRTTFQDRNGNVATTVYDTVNRPVKAIHADGTLRVTTYDPAGRILAETDERGFTTTHGYDAAGHRTSVTDATGKVTAFEYNAAGVQIAITDALGRKTQSTLDALNRVVKTTYADGSTRQTAYDAVGRRISETDEANITTQFVYLPTGELDQVLQPDPAVATTFAVVTQYVHDRLGRKVQQIDALGRTTSFSYTTRDELASSTRPMGQTENFTYDAQGNLKTRTDAAGATTTYNYNSLNLLQSKLFPDGSSHAFEYYPGGQRKSFTITPTGGAPQTTSLVFDNRARLTQQTNPDGSTLTWGYDSAGNRNRVQTSYQTITSTFNARNELAQVLRNGSDWADYSYDAVGNRSGLSFVNGTRTAYIYDLRHRLLSITNYQKPIGTTTTNYLLDPSLVSAWKLDESSAQYADQKGANPFTSQGAGAIPGVPGRIGQGVDFTAAANSYIETTPASLSSTMGFPAGKGTLVCFYKPDVTYPLASGESDLFTTREEGAIGVSRHRFGITAAGALTMSEDGFFSTTTSAPQTWSATAFSALAFRWNASGTAIFKDASPVATGFTGFFDNNVNAFILGNHPQGTDLGVAGFGARGTLDEVALFARDLSNAEIADIATRGLEPVVEQVFSSYAYSLDVRGLRTKVVELSGRTENYTYDNLKRLTKEQIIEGSSVTTIDYTLDKVGNRLAKAVTFPGGGVQTTTYTYDANDQLNSEAGPAGTTTYAYTANGETASKTSPSESAVYSWDFESHLVQLISSSSGTVAYTYDVDGSRMSKTVGGIVTKFLVDKNLELAQVLEERSISGVVNIAYVYGDSVISQENTAVAPSLAVHFYHQDGQSSTRQLTDITATVTDNYTFDAFGVTLSSSGTTGNNILYSGEQRDPESQLDFLRGRYLNTATGRFLSLDSDPGFDRMPISLHRYLYVGANPVGFVDPTGNSLMETGAGYGEFGRQVHRTLGAIFLEQMYLLGDFDSGSDALIQNILGVKNKAAGSLRRPDLFNGNRFEFYEIKPNNPGGLVDGLTRIVEYQIIFNSLDRFKSPWHPGFTFILPQNIPIGGDIVQFMYAAPGLIVYSSVVEAEEKLKMLKRQEDYQIQLLNAMFAIGQLYSVGTSLITAAGSLVRASLLSKTDVPGKPLAPTGRPTPGTPIRGNDMPPGYRPDITPRTVPRPDVGGSPWRPSVPTIPGLVPTLQ